MNVLDLFSGIGGFSLGLERAGMRTVAFCECEPYARAVLRKHWPEVPCYDDVRTLTAARLAADGVPAPQVIAGGFPCQDISSSGHKVGISGAKSGLWTEYARLIGEIRPRYVIVENVAALLARGIDTVLGDLAALGFDAEWDVVSASMLGAPHHRDRVWLVAYPNSHGQSSRAVNDEASWMQKPRRTNGTDPQRRERPLGWLMEGMRRHWKLVTGNGIWNLEDSPIGMGVVDGFPARMDRLRCLGNAVVPQIPEIIGRAILAAEAQR